MRIAIEALEEARARELGRLRCLAADVRRVRRPGVRPSLTKAYEDDLAEGLVERHDFAKAIAILKKAAK